MYVFRWLLILAHEHHPSRLKQNGSMVIGFAQGMEGSCAVGRCGPSGERFYLAGTITRSQQTRSQTSLQPHTWSTTITRPQALQAYLLPLAMLFFAGLFLIGVFLAATFAGTAFFAGTVFLVANLTPPFGISLTILFLSTNYARNGRTVRKFFLSEDVTVYGNTTASFAR